MEVQTWSDRTELEEVSGEVLGFDLEMANSFSDRKGVICMIGIGCYDPTAANIHVTIGSTTKVTEERELIQWFLDELAKFAARHERPKLLSFSGLDNDIPWINERLERLDIQAPEDSVITQFVQLDLKREFYRRTHNNHISLKKLEKIFGIERGSSLTSKKVSYLLTHIMQNHQRGNGIPTHVTDYLRQDVRHLLLILDRWAAHPLDGHHITDVEYLTLVNSLFNLCRKVLRSSRMKRALQQETSVVAAFAGELQSQFDRLLIKDDFEEFTLPSLPPIDSRHFDLQRLVKKYNHLKSIQLRDEQTGEIRLTRTLDKPKGALAVVRNKGRLLMIRRADHLDRAPGVWGLPGGAFEVGESPGQCAVRELAEELALQGREVRLMGTSTSLRGEYRLFWVEVEVDNVSQIDVNAAEVAEYRWVTPEQISRLKPLIPGAVEGLREFLGAEWASAARQS
ncbi:MAG: NUDIX domain-containing protein [Candidatus Lambdaproteobacteria bacterium]|nr:NUDIX domain-containing protein [Candidatus Lambdaproteobacteria bacterium]